MGYEKEKRKLNRTKRRKKGLADADQERQTKADIPGTCRYNDARLDKFLQTDSNYINKMPVPYSGPHYPKSCLFLIAALSNIFYYSFFLFSLVSSDSGSCGQKRLVFGTSAAGTAVAASEAAGSSEVPTWAWTSSGWRSWRRLPRPRSPPPALSQTCVMASPCCNLGSGSLQRKHPKWMVWICCDLFYISL